MTRLAACETCPIKNGGRDPNGFCILAGCFAEASIPPVYLFDDNRRALEEYVQELPDTSVEKIISLQPIVKQKLNYLCQHSNNPQSAMNGLNASFQEALDTLESLGDDDRFALATCVSGYLRFNYGRQSQTQ